MAVPNGTYNVTVAVGDGGYPSTYTINVEGVNYWNGVSLATGQFVNQTKTITVNDGRLTIDEGSLGWEATRIDYVVIKPVTVATIPANADTYVRDGSYASTNYGTQTALCVKKNATTGFNRWTYLKFDISKFSTVNTAKLSLTACLNAAGSIGTDIYSESNTSWTETGLTWNNRPGVGTRLGSVIVNGTTAALYSVDVSSYVAAQRAAGKTTVSFVLTNPTATDPISTIYSRETANKPSLIMTGK